MQKRQLLHIALSVLIISVWGVLMVLFASYFTNREVDKAKSNPEKVSVSDHMKLLDSGTFQMGSPETERQREENEVLHEVKIDSFYISPLEVTQKEYEELMGKNPSEFHGEDLPIENVSWFDAVEYCNKLSEKNGLTPAYRVNGKEVEWDQNANGYRLPTEAEWEYACRANTTTPFNTETSISDQESNYYGHYPYLIEENYFSQGNLDTLQYDEELLKLWNIPKCMLPEIVDSSKIYGHVKGLFAHPIPIASMIGDQQAALFGQTCFEAGSVKNTYGTGCFLLMNTKNKRIHSKHGLLTCAGWSIQGECTYVLEGSVFIAGAVIQWLRDNLQIISDSSESEKMAVNCEDNGGVVFVPSFTGLGAPYWKPGVKGAVFGLTRGTSKEQIVRAALESLAYQTNDVLCAMQEDSNMQIEKLQVDGGASANSFLLQFQSDITKTQVIRPVIFETTALGAAYLAGLACGFWKNQEEIRKYFQVSACFTPKMDTQTRETNLTKWKKAIHAVLQF